MVKIHIFVVTEFKKTSDELVHSQREQRPLIHQCFLIQHGFEIEVQPKVAIGL